MFRHLFSTINRKDPGPECEHESDVHEKLLSPEDYFDQIQTKYPIRHLNSRHKRWIRDLSKTSIHDPGETIFESGEYSSHAIYLLSGSIELEADDGVKSSINGSDESALYPLARVNPSRYTATALEPRTVMLWVHRKLIKDCIANQFRDGASEFTESYIVEIVPDRRCQTRE